MLRWDEKRQQWLQGHRRDTPAKILIAEDQASIAELLREILHEEGYGVIGPAASCTAALDLIDDDCLVAALLDLDLEDGESFAVAECLADRGTPFAFVTGYGSERIPTHLKGHPLLSKPMSTRTVLRTVEGLCHGRERVPAAGR